jgi:hypothetical protein
MLRCLCCVEKYTYITAKTFINPLFLSLQMNCPDSSSRNKAKNALSLARPFSLGLAEAKIQSFSFVEEKRKKSCDNYINF